MASNTTRIVAQPIGGKPTFIDISNDDANKIKNEPSGISKFAKIVDNKAIIFYVDKNLKVRGPEIAIFAGVDSSEPGSFAAFCTTIESKIKDRKCEAIASPILRTVCKKDEYKNCDRLSKNQLVNLVCKK
jgi:hypothetical protein